MNVYTPPVSKIVHETEVDFGKRTSTKLLRFVQYDRGLPIVAVSLFFNGKPYTIPADAEVNIRFGKKDHTFVYNPVLGCNAARNKIYFEITYQMTVEEGRFAPIIEILLGEEAAGTSEIGMEITRNPVQEDDVESSTEYISFASYIEKAKESADIAVTNAEISERAKEATVTAADNAMAAETNAALAAGMAKEKADAAKKSEAAAVQSAENASASERAAKKSENEAKNYAGLAQQIAIDNGFAAFHLDYKTGRLTLVRTTNIADRLNFTFDKYTGLLKAVIS